MSLKPIISFDEASYLEANPDVAQAVSAGCMISGWLHYLQFGFKERRDGVPESTRNLVERVQLLSPICPPNHLISRVHGSPNVFTFNDTGRAIALDIIKILCEHTNTDQIRSIFEFGCGCGRIIYPLINIFTRAEFSGSDIDKEAVQWIISGISISGPGLREILVNDDMPPLPLASESFDLAYAISVLTHLPIAMQDAWIAELWRITKRGGYILVTTQNEDLILEHIGNSERRQLLEEGVFYKSFQSTIGLPEYYQAAWHTKQYLVKRWAHLINLVCHIPRGVVGHQDLTLYQRR